ncbi:FecR family protein [Caulobacter sp. LjRoot300]|uniref:FecR family protein n=1 Tax=Caulobacter sp. LjRoot300 TaxID=3342321 RepID=UPI003ECD71AD
MNEAVDPDSPIGQTARAWALAVVGEDFPPERSRQFGAWLDADPAHRRAYEQAETVVMMLGGLRTQTAVAPARPPTARWRVPVMAAAGGLLAACLALAVLATLPGPTYETRPGQSRQVALSDGSQVTLAPASRLRAASRWRPRALALERGEAFFVVAHQPSGQPFTVQAANALVRVVGTRFNVHRGADSAVRVEVEQGVVQVSNHPDGQDRAVTLRAGQTAIADAHGLAVGVLAPSSLAGGWRQGRLAYDDAPLSEVVADLNRYSRRPLTIGSPAAARLKVTAAFDIAQADRFVAELPRALPVRLIPDGRGGRVLVAADPGRAPEPHAP